MKTDRYIKRSSTIILCLLIICLAITGFLSAQTKDTIKPDLKLKLADTPDNMSPLKKQISGVVKTLANNNEYQTISYTKTRLKYKIEEDSQFYKLPGGDSRVALFKLPDYENDYFLKIRSMVHGIGYKYHIFYPTGIFLDSSFRPTHLLPEKQFLITDYNPAFPVHLEADVVVDNDRKKDKYLLIYTLDKDERIGSYTDARQGILTSLFKHPVERSAFGKLELELHLR